MSSERLREIRERLEHHCDNYQNFAGFSLSAPSDIRWLLERVEELEAQKVSAWKFLADGEGSND